MSDSTKEEYLEGLIKSIIDGEKEIPEEHRIPEKLFSIWLVKLKKAVDDAFLEYLTNGSRDTYVLSTEEFEKTFEDAGMDYTDSLVSELVDEDLLEAVIDENGNILYTLSHNAKKYIK